ncbi:uncharacterized protein LOC120341782 [Styela clava]
MISTMYGALVLLGCLICSNAYLIRPDDGGTQAKMVSNAARYTLAVATITKRISYDEEDEAWRNINDCLEEIKESEDMMDRLLDWQYLTEFIELQITKSLNFNYEKEKHTASIGGNGKLDLFIRLTPVKYWDILEGTQYPIPLNIWKHREAAAELLLQACNDDKTEDNMLHDLPEDVKDILGKEEIRKIFNALLIDAYVSDAFTEEDKAKLSETTKRWQLEKKWKKIADKILDSDSYLMTTCLDGSLAFDEERQVDRKLREIASDLGVYECKPIITVQPVQFFTAMPPVQLMIVEFSDAAPVPRRRSVLPPPSNINNDDHDDGPPQSPGRVRNFAAP